MCNVGLVAQVVVQRISLLWRCIVDVDSYIIPKFGINLLQRKPGGLRKIEIYDGDEDNGLVDYN